MVIHLTNQIKSAPNVLWGSFPTALKELYKIYKFHNEGFVRAANMSDCIKDQTSVNSPLTITLIINTDVTRSRFSW